MRIYLVRHGESEANVDKTIGMRMPDHAIGLTPLGHEQATKCGTYLRERCSVRGTSLRMWHSPYRRTVETAGHIHDEMGLLIRRRSEHILLGEQQFGLFDGVPEDELPVRFPAEHAHYQKHEKFEGRFWARMPCGESRFDVAQRVHQAFGTFHRDIAKYGEEDLIVVCHGVVIRAFVMMWCHKSVEWFEREPNPKNCTVRLIDDDGEDAGCIYECP